MLLDKELLERFEVGLNPQQPHNSLVKAKVVGYGEISTIFNIDGDSSIAYKRMPLFPDRRAAQAYEADYFEYCDLLKQVGISVPENQTEIIEVPARPIVLYIAQAMLPPERFGHKLIHTQNKKENERLVERIIEESKKVWQFSRENGPKLEIALDGQLSNWVYMNGEKDILYYIDTSTPFVRKNGMHQLESELLIKTMPKILRYFIKEKTIANVLDRYYNPGKNMTDLAGNLYKEQKPELVPVFIDIINQLLPDDIDKLTLKSVKSYYREDKAIWALFVRLRKLDCFFTTKLLRRRYEYILPGKVKR